MARTALGVSGPPRRAAGRDPSRRRLISSIGVAACEKARRGLDQPAIRVARARGHRVHRGAPGRRRVARRHVGRGQQHRADDLLQVTMGQLGLGVARRDRLALLGQPEASLHGSRRLRANRASGRPAPARHCPTAAVEERERDAVLSARRRHGLLSLVERPAGGQVAAVLVAVGVADHHGLPPAALVEVGAIGRQREQRRQDARRRLKIVERLEQRHDRQPRRAACPAREQHHRQDVGRAARHGHDE